MGNCIAFSRPSRRVAWDPSEEDEDNVLRVIKANGDVMEFDTSVLVRDLTSSFDGFGVGVSRGSFRCLPPEHELKVGRVYYLLPLDAKDLAMETSSVSCSERIRVVLTKQQLQELLSGIEREQGSWKPDLETIREEM